MARSNSAKTRSPLKQIPLRTPGESLRNQMEDQLGSIVVPWFAVAALVIFWVWMEWVRHFKPFEPQPVMATVIALIVAILAFFRIRRAHRKFRNMNQGWVGECAVGQFLELLRTDGYMVIHDIPEKNFNIDHVLLGPTGVFAIETKTRRKPVDRDAQIIYDGERVLVDGHECDRDPLKQAEANARWVQELIEKRTGRRVPVRAVVVFPGWFVDRRCPSPKIWVVNEKYLISWLDHEPKTLSNEDVRRYAAVIEDHVRGWDA